MHHDGAGPVVLGMLPFGLSGLAIALIDAPVPPELSFVVAIGGILLWSGYPLVLGLLLTGWLAGFPRWVFPYLGYAVFIPLLLFNASTPGLSLFGIQIWGRELWGWRAFVPLGLVILLGLLLSRPPWGNLVRLVRRAWEDWTLPAFCLYGLLPLSGLIILDEVDRSLAFGAELAGILIIILGAFLYMRSSRPGLGYLGLLVCGVAAEGFMSGSAGYYWATHYVNFTSGVKYLLATPVDWSAVLREAARGAAVVAVYLLIPLLLALARLVYRRFHPSGQIHP